MRTAATRVYHAAIPSQRKEADMSAPTVQTQRKARTRYQKVSIIREECEMRFGIGMARVNRWLHESFARKTSVKLLGRLAVGAMLITVTTFTYFELRQGEAASPSSSSEDSQGLQAPAYWVQKDEAEEMLFDELSKNFMGSASSSTENSQELQASAYWVQRDEVEEMLFDQLSKNFIGVPVSSNEAIDASQPYILPEIFEEDVNERVYDELRISFVGIPAPQVKPIDASQPYILPEIFEEDVNERVYDELRMSFVGIPAPRSEATDRLLPVGEDQ
jgi:hypothetical protein